MMLGNPLLPVLGELNAGFGGDTPAVRTDMAPHFAAGADLGSGLAAALGPQKAELGGLLNAYVKMMPGGMRESLRAAIHYALTASPRVLITFAWVPAYDWELDIWEIVEPAPNHSGMTILLKSRYPDHKERFG